MDTYQYITSNGTVFFATLGDNVVGYEDMKDAFLDHNTNRGNFSVTEKNKIINSVRRGGRRPISQVGEDGKPLGMSKGGGKKSTSLKK